MFVIVTMILVIIFLVVTAESVTETPTSVPRTSMEEASPPLDYSKPRSTWQQPLKKNAVDYNIYITSGKWYENPVRKMRLFNANYACELCTSTSHIEVHHTHYASLGSESLSDIIVLCKECHDYTHKVAGKGAKHYPALRRPNANEGIRTAS